MAAPAYTEFEWHSERAANGAAGEKLNEVFVSLVQKLGGVRSICDLGCGNGHIAGSLTALGYEVTGIDASRSGIRDRKSTRLHSSHLVTSYAVCCLQKQNR